MNDTYIVTVLVILDDVLKAYAYPEDCRTQSSAAEVLTVAVAARYFQNHHERALCLLRQLGVGFCLAQWGEFVWR